MTDSFSDVGPGSLSTTSWVLVVDDEAGIRAVLTRLLTKMGLLVEEAASGAEAKEAIRKRDYTLIISDISMPSMDGMTLLREIRAYDYDVPVILMTGKPSFESAIAAVEHGAFHYFVKPFDNDEFRSAVSRAIHLARIARAKRRALELLGTERKQPSDLAGLAASLERAMDMMWIAFQPVVHADREHAVYGFEALLRSSEPSLPHPGAIIGAAERLDRLPELGRLIRGRAANPFKDRGDQILFVNLHPQDLLDPELDNPSSPLTRIAPRVVLEITERASLENLEDVRKRVGVLRSRGFRIAVDDLGAGYAGLTSLATLQPEIVKIDMSLVRGIDGDVTRQRLVHSITRACQDLSILVVAEGIETTEEGDTAAQLGCNLLQGFHFGRPGRLSPEANL